jgi:hypothetical protein
MKKLPVFPLLLAAIIVAGFTSGRVLRQKSPVRPAPKAVALNAYSLNKPTAEALRGAVSLEADSAMLRQWLDEASVLASSESSDLAMDAPHLLLALAAWSAHDLARLMADVQRLPEGPARTRLEDWILSEWAARAPGPALAWTREHRPDKYGAAVEALAHHDPAAAWQAVQEHPVPGGRAGDTASHIFSRWAAADRMAALDAWLLMDKKGDLSFRAGMGFGENALPQKGKDPDAWTSALQALTQRVMEEPDSKSWVTTIDLIRNCIETSQRHEDTTPAQRRTELTAWLRGLNLDENEFASQLTMVAQHDGASADLAPEAWPWLWREAPESQRGQTMKSIVKYWASDDQWSAKDPDACGQWLNSLQPLGAEHGEALKDFAQYAAARDPVSGLAWAQANPDPAARAVATKEVHAIILKQWPHRAAELGVPMP